MRSALLFISILILTTVILSTPNEIIINYALKPGTRVTIPSEQYQMLPYVEPKQAEYEENNIVATATGGSRYLRLIALDVYTGKGWTISEISLEKYVKTTIIAYKKESFENFEVVLKLNIDKIPKLGELYIIPYPQPMIVPEGVLYIKAPYDIFYEPSGMFFASLNLTRELIFGLIPSDVYPKGMLIVSKLKVKEIIMLTNETQSNWVKEHTLSISPKVRDLSKKIYSLFENRTLAELLSYIDSYLKANTEYSKEDVETPPGKDLVEYFLFEKRKGTCVHYASAAAIILRLIGFKTRVVVGYLGEVLENGTIVYKEPGHMWMEILIPGVGWVPYDPSPGIPTVSETFRRTLRTALENIAIVEGNFSIIRTKRGMRVKFKKLEFENETYQLPSPKEELLTTVSMEIWDIIPYLIIGYIIFTYSTSDIKPVIKDIFKAYRRTSSVSDKFKKILKRIGRRQGLFISDYETPREAVEKVIARISDLNIKNILREVLKAYEDFSYGKGSIKEFYKKLKKLAKQRIK